MVESVNYTVSTSSLEIVNNQIDVFFEDPVKDYEWYKTAFAFIDSSESLKANRAIQAALLMVVSDFLMDYVKTKSSVKNCASKLYVMASSSMGAVKIGRTKGDVGQRAKQLRCGCPDAQVIHVFEGHGDLEPVIHKRLSEFSTGGEWFSVSQEFAEQVVKEEIKNMADRYSSELGG